MVNFGFPDEWRLLLGTFKIKINICKTKKKNDIPRSKTKSLSNMQEFLFRIIYILNNFNFLDQCRELVFPSSLLFEGERLINHVLASAGVIDKDFCEFQCYKERNCVSINFEITPSASGIQNCELNNSTHKEHEKDLVKAANYLYHGTNVRSARNTMWNI